MRCTGPTLFALAQSCVWTLVLSAFSLAPGSAEVAICIDLHRHAPIDMCRHVSGCINMYMLSIVLDSCLYLSMNVDMRRCAMYRCVPLCNAVCRYTSVCVEMYGCVSISVDMYRYLSICVCVCVCRYVSTGTDRHRQISMGIDWYQ